MVVGAYEFAGANGRIDGITFTEDANGSKIYLNTSNNTTKTNTETGSLELGISLVGHVCADNSSTTALGVGSIFLGSWQDTLEYGTVSIGIIADQDSITDGLEIQWSSDATTKAQDDIFTISANTGKTFKFGPANRYVRLKYTNGPVAQTLFNLETTMRRVYTIPSTHRIQDSIIGEDDAQLVKAILTAKSNGGGFVNIEATAANNLRVTDAESVFAIAKGDVPGTTIVHKFGKHEDVDTTFEPLSIGGIYQTPQVAAATTLRVKAGNAADDVGSTGARLITLQGLDETGSLVTENLAPLGESIGSAGTVTWIRVFRAHISETGTYAGAGTDSHVADIVIENSAGTADWLTIHKPDVGRGQSQIGQYTVPLGSTAYVFSYLLTTDSNKAVDFLFFKREGILNTAPPYQARRTIVEEIGVQGHLNGHFEGGQKFTELTDIGWMVKAAAAAQATVDFEIILVNN